MKITTMPTSMSSAPTGSFGAVIGYGHWQLGVFGSHEQIKFLLIWWIVAVRFGRVGGDRS